MGRSEHVSASNRGWCNRDSIAPLLIFAALAGLGALYIAACRASSPMGDKDPFDSGLWGAGWLILPGVACVAALARPMHPLVPAVALAGPQAVATFLFGVVWFDPADGASFWIVGEALVVGLGAIVALGAAVGNAVRGSR